MAEAPVTSELFDGLFDDAAIFPPGNAPMPDAVRGYAEHQASWYAATVGLFVCSATRLDELASAREADARPLDVALTVSDGIAALQHAAGAAAWSEALRPRAVEVPLGEFSPDQAARQLGAFAEMGAATAAPLQCYLEIPAGDADEPTLDAVRAAGLRLKLRTGGTAAAAFPSEPTLAAAIQAAVGAGLAFKCTAGLHHAVRYSDPVTGFEHHGFLNVLLAVHRALSGDDAGEVAAALAERESTAVAGAVRELDADGTRAVRERFISFGTCSVAEPIEDLRALGLVSKPS